MSFYDWDCLKFPIVTECDYFPLCVVVFPSSVTVQVFEICFPRVLTECDCFPCFSTECDCFPCFSTECDCFPSTDCFSCNAPCD